MGKSTLIKKIMLSLMNSKAKVLAIDPGEDFTFFKGKKNFKVIQDVTDESKVLKAIKKVTKKTIDKKKPQNYWLVMDEAHNFLPLHKITPIKTEVHRIINAGRKFLLSSVISTTKPASISTTPRSMWSIGFCFNLLGADLRLAVRDLGLPTVFKKTLPFLSRGHCVVRERSENPYFHQIRWRDDEIVPKGRIVI